MSSPAPAWPRWLLWVCVTLGGLALLLALLLLALGGVALLQRRDRGFYRNTPEAKANLKAIYTSERSYFQERDRYSEDLAEIGFDPERTNRYAYFVATSGVMQDRSTREPPGAGAHQAVGVDLARFSGRPGMVVTFAQLPPVSGGKAGVTGKCPDCEFIAVAVGNLDDDPALDVWSIASFERTSAQGEHIAAGQPFNEYDDVKETQPQPLGP